MEAAHRQPPRAADSMLDRVHADAGTFCCPFELGVEGGDGQALADGELQIDPVVGGDAKLTRQLENPVEGARGVVVGNANGQFGQPAEEGAGVRRGLALLALESEQDVGDFLVPELSGTPMCGFRPL